MTSCDVEVFLQLEAAVWRALGAGDAEADAALLADDFMGVYGTGVAGKAEHVAQLRAGPTVAKFQLSDARVLVLGAGVVLLTYRADWIRLPRAIPEEMETMYVSSIWRKTGRKWRNVFSQDTNAS